MQIKNQLNIVSIALWTSLVLGGCNGLTKEQAKIALEEVALSSKAASLVSGTLELSTSFTIGDALEAVAQEVHAFLESQLPCAAVSLQDNTLTVEYGANGVCYYNGQLYEGTHAITIASTAAGHLEVAHEWQNLNDGLMSVSGTATVSWSSQESTRHVSHELTWTRISDGRTGTGTGHRYQQGLDDDWTAGVVVQGNRKWQGEFGQWDLDINQVEMRWIDPVPQGGSYLLDTPFDKTASLSFKRVDEDTIAVTVESDRHKFTFHINQLGLIESQ